MKKTNATNDTDSHPDLQSNPNTFNPLAALQGKNSGSVLTRLIGLRSQEAPSSAAAAAAVVREPGHNPPLITTCREKTKERSGSECRPQHQAIWKTWEPLSSLHSASFFFPRGRHLLLLCRCRPSFVLVDGRIYRLQFDPPPSPIKWLAFGFGAARLLLLFRDSEQQHNSATEH